MGRYHHSVCPDSGELWVFFDHRTLAQVIAGERQP
jgi:hypothetical protein